MRGRGERRERSETKVTEREKREREGERGCFVLTEERLHQTNLCAENEQANKIASPTM